MHTYVLVPPEIPHLTSTANPRLSTLYEVEGILVENQRDWKGPLSFAEIGRRMNAKRTRPEVIRACVQELARQKRAIIGSNGVDLLTPSPALVGVRLVPLE